MRSNKISVAYPNIMSVLLSFTHTKVRVKDERREKKQKRDKSCLSDSLTPALTIVPSSSSIFTTENITIVDKDRMHHSFESIRYPQFFMVNRWSLGYYSLTDSRVHHSTSRCHSMWFMEGFLIWSSSLISFILPLLLYVFFPHFSFSSQLIIPFSLSCDWTHASSCHMSSLSTLFYYSISILSPSPPLLMRQNKLD